MPGCTLIRYDRIVVSSWRLMIASCFASVDSTRSRHRGIKALRLRHIGSVADPGGWGWAIGPASGRARMWGAYRGPRSTGGGQRPLSPNREASC